MNHGESGVIAAGEGDTGGRAGSFHYRINGRVIAICDCKVTGRELLATAGFDPAPDYILIRIVDHGTRSIGLDVAVELGCGVPLVFRAFRSDRAFNFMLDERGCEWGAPKIAEQELREIGDIPESKILMIERKHEPDLEIEEGQYVSLEEKCIERIRSETAVVLVYLDHIEKKIARGTYTTEELGTALGVEAGYVLDVVTRDGRLEALKPGEKIRVCNGMNFISQAPCGGSS